MKCKRDEVLLEVKDLHIHFENDKERLKAVEGVSFEVKVGETLGIVGESGSGKSITCMSILKLIQGNHVVYESGEVLFKGQDLLSLSDKALSKIRGNEISYIFQEPMTALNPLFTIGNQMTESLKMHAKLSKHRAMEACIRYLEKVNIANPHAVFASYPHRLSGGMRQRVMIAMALITNPQLVIADEPTTALDVTIQAQILDLLKTLQGDIACSYLLITHDLGVINEMCDGVLVMYGGRICESATGDELFDHPMHPYTQGLIASHPHRNVKAKRLPIIPGNVPSLDHKPSGCPFHPRCDYAMDLCQKAFPEPIHINDDHVVSCWKIIKESENYECNH